MKKESEKTEKAKYAIQQYDAKHKNRYYYIIISSMLSISIIENIMLETSIELIE